MIVSSTVTWFPVTFERSDWLTLGAIRYIGRHARGVLQADGLTEEKGLWLLCGRRLD